LMLAANPSRALRSIFRRGFAAAASNTKSETDRRDEGDRPVCTTNGRKIGDTSRRRPKGLAFTDRGPQARC
jgi:hypothetical protein